MTVVSQKQHGHVCELYKTNIMRPAQWRSKLFLHLQHQQPVWVPIPIPAASLSSQLYPCGLGQQQRTAQSQGTLHPLARPSLGLTPGSGPAPAVMAICGVNLLSLYNLLFK